MSEVVDINVQHIFNRNFSNGLDNSSKFKHNYGQTHCTHSIVVMKGKKEN